MRDATGRFTSGLHVLAGFMVLAGVVALVLGHDPWFERAEAAHPAE
jgi:hypothetical protein